MSELLQQLSQVGDLGELSVDPGQFVEDRTVQGHTGHLPLGAAAAVPTDLNTKVTISPEDDRRVPDLNIKTLQVQVKVSECILPTIFSS